MLSGDSLSFTQRSRSSASSQRKSLLRLKDWSLFGLWSHSLSCCTGCRHSWCPGLTDGVYMSVQQDSAGLECLVFAAHVTAGSAGGGSVMTPAHGYRLIHFLCHISHAGGRVPVTSRRPHADDKDAGRDKTRRRIQIINELLWTDKTDSALR